MPDKRRSRQVHAGRTDHTNIGAFGLGVFSRPFPLLVHGTAITRNVCFESVFARDLRGELRRKPKRVVQLEDGTTA